MKEKITKISKNEETSHGIAWKNKYKAIKAMCKDVALDDIDDAQVRTRHGKHGRTREGIRG